MNISIVSSFSSTAISVSLERWAIPLSKKLWDNGPADPSATIISLNNPRPEREFSPHEFHDYWLRHAGRGGGELPLVMSAVHWQPVLTHGDLSPQNVMVKDGQVVAILDWETFGWYPDFWEYMILFSGSCVAEAREAVQAVFGVLPDIGWLYMELFYSSGNQEENHKDGGMHCSRGLCALFYSHCLHEDICLCL